MLNSFALFVGGSLAILAVLGDLGCVIQQPKPFFAPLRWTRRIWARRASGPNSSAAWSAARRSRSSSAPCRRSVGRAPRGPPKILTLGDIEPLMPRNGAETLWTGLLSINAGVGEELFFRLALPLLIVLVTGNVVAAFAVAAIMFGLVHVYQGWVGVLATTFLGFVFTGVYLSPAAWGCRWRCTPDRPSEPGRPRHLHAPR